MAADEDLSSRNSINRADALLDLRKVQAAGQVPRALDSLASPLVVLNAARQVIFANKALPGFRTQCGHRGDLRQEAGRDPGVRARARRLR